MLFARVTVTVRCETGKGPGIELSARAAEHVIDARAPAKPWRRARETMRSVSRARDIEFNRCRCEDTNSCLLRDEARRTPSRSALRTEAVDAGGLGGKSAESAAAVGFPR